jgi:hypothetical protein
VEIPFAILTAVFIGYLILSMRWLREHERRIEALSRHVGTLIVWYDKTVYPKKVK